MGLGAVVAASIAFAASALACGGGDDCDKVGTSWCEGDTVVACAVDKVAFPRMLLRGKCPAKHCVESPDGKLAECL